MMANKPETPENAAAAPPDEKLPFFPYRFLAVDAGSNSIKFRAWEIDEDGSAHALAERRYPVRLGQGTFRDGVVSEQNIAAAVEAFQDIQLEYDTLGIHAMRAVATSAAREASNGLTLVRRVAKQTGINLEILPPAEEARLIALGVLGMLPRLSEQYLLIDIGGGSTEIILAGDPDIISALSVRLGAVRLREMFFPVSPPTSTQVALAKDHIRDVLGKTLHLPGRQEDLHCLGGAGTITALHAMVGALTGRRETDGEISLLEIDTVVERVMKLSVDEIAKEFGLDTQRAEIILPGALVLRAILQQLRIERIGLAHGGVGDGLLHVFLEHAGLRRSQLFDHDRAFMAHAFALGERYHFIRHHAQQVSRLATSLFDQLGPLHMLGPADRRILKGAALLHDIGQFIGFSVHHKHSHYLIIHSDLPGLSAAEKRMMAAVARYHRKAHPKSGHVEFMDLDKSTRARVRKLAAILRIADGLDREQQSLVSGVRVQILPREVHFYLSVHYQAAVEVWSARQKATLFEEVFGRLPQFFIVNI